MAERAKAGDIQRSNCGHIPFITASNRLSALLELS